MTKTCRIVFMSLFVYSSYFELRLVSDKIGIGMGLFSNKEPLYLMFCNKFITEWLAIFKLKIHKSIMMLFIRKCVLFVIKIQKNRRLKNFCLKKLACFFIYLFVFSDFYHFDIFSWITLYKLYINDREKMCNVIFVC